MSQISLFIFLNEPDTIFGRPSRFIYSYFPFFDKFVQCFFFDFNCFCLKGQLRSQKFNGKSSITNLCYPTFLSVH